MTVTDCLKLLISTGCELTHKTMEIHVSAKNVILVFQSRSDRAENNCKRPKLSKARDNIDQLSKDVRRSVRLSYQ